jgi:hypothetical protein
MPVSRTAGTRYTDVHGSSPVQDEPGVAFRRLSRDFNVEVSFEDSTKLLEADGVDIGTYESTSKPDGSLTARAAAFEFDVDRDGNAHSKLLEWK